MFDWDDLRVFTATVRSGSFAAAAVRLGMDATTVGRRIQRLESALKATLLVRSSNGLELTSAGARLHAVGSRVKTAIDQVEQGSGSRGSVRISASEGFGAHILAPALGKLFKEQNTLSIELAANQGFLSPSTREVDMAITLTPSNSPRVHVQVLTDYELGLFASADYLKASPAPKSPDDLPAHPFIGYIDDMIYAPELRYLEEVHRDIRAQLTSSSIRAQVEFTAAGAGLAILPCFLVQPHHRLERLLPDDVRLIRTFWLSTHHDIKDTVRVRAIRKWVTDLVLEVRDVLLPSG